MSRTTLAVLVVGALFVVAGIGMVHKPSAFIAAGIACLAYGLTRDVPETKKDGEASR